MGVRYYDPVSGRWIESTANEPPLGYLGYPWTPSSQLPHLVRNLVKFPLAQTLMSAQPILGFTPVSETPVIAGRRGGTTQGTTSGSNINTSNMRFWQLERSGSGTKDGFMRHWGAAPFHHILDPTGGLAGWTPIFHDFVRVDFVSGNAWAAVGFVNANTSNDETTFVGAMFKASSADGYWKTALLDGTGTSNVLHSTSLNSLTVSTARRLSIVLDAASKSVLWYADYELVDTFTPSSPIGQMTAIPRLGYYGITAISADLKIQVMGGGNPRMFSMKRAA